MKQEIKQRLEALRHEMKIADVAATIIPQTDPHHSEYIGAHWQVRRWLSGFTGSAGALVVTLDSAYVWADSRYWIQSRRQLADTEIGVMEEGKPDVPSIEQYLASTLKPGDAVGIDGMLFSVAEVTAMDNALAEHDIALIDNFDPIDTIWTDRPALPDDKIFIHDEKYSGESARAKLDKVLAVTSSRGADTVLISDLAEIAWALNIRSNDVKYNPVATSYLFIAPEGAVLFVDPSKLTVESAEYLAANGVETAHYLDIIKFLQQLPADRKVAFNPATTSITVKKAIGQRGKETPSPIAYLKGCKNPTQIASVRQAMEDDGVALVKSFMELEQRMASGVKTTEMDVAEILERHRSHIDGYMQPSFGSIVGFADHGAIVHYEATEETNVELHPDNLLLVDSGGNYHQGTTDITRTITLGQPTDEQRHDFTLVMKGHIQLGMAIFPEGTRGDQLDVLARINLWKEGKSYLHGTGHGVGFFLNCHEGPQSIRLNHVNADLRPGMITSNEPGIYREGKYGIRCENLVLTVDAFTTEYGKFYRFENLTLFPFDLRLFEKSIMTAEEIEWLNNYHELVYNRLAPRLDDAERAWLKEKTAKL